MQCTNALDKYAIAVKIEASQVVGHLLLGKSAKNLNFLKASENNYCIVVVCGKRLNQGDGKDMKVPCTL